MPIAIEMPKLSDTMTEGTLVRWIKKVGDTVAVGDVLAEVETDKATMEMEAFDEGVLTEIYVKDGEKVQIGQKLALLSGQDEKPPSTAPSQVKEPTPEQAGKPKAAPAEEAAAIIKTPTVNAETQPSKDQAPDDAQRETLEPTADARIKASPLARKIAAEMGVDLARLQGSGPAGRIVRDDVVAAAQTTSPKKPAAPQTPPTEPQPPVAAAGDKRIPLSGMRKTIATRLLESKTTIPHFYLQSEINAEPLAKLRHEINAAAEA